MIKITKQIDYALQFLTALHTRGGSEPLSVKEFSKESTISFLFLQKIAKLLREADLITAKKGSNGGYILSRPLSEMTIKDVIEAVEGPYGISTCTTKGKRCDQTHRCTLKKGIEKMHEHMTRELERMSVADIVV